MMRFIKKRKWMLITLIALLMIGWIYWKMKHGRNAGEETIFLQPKHGSIQQIVSTTGTVKPQNRLELKSTISARIEKIFVQEGDAVKKSDILALLSSTERSSLLDAAQLQSAETLTYWEDVYKPIPLLSPIDGQVIVRDFEPGQSVTTADAVLVLSDQLIVVAQVDETDIGYIKKGQQATVTLDAYPDIEVNGTVSHISFESLLVNNVTIYEVDVIPDEIPDVFRSGMSANVEIIQAKKDNVLLLPNYAIQNEKTGKKFVMIKGPGGRKERAQVTIGITDEENTEIVSGLNESDTVIWTQESRKYLSRDSGRNPFMPDRRRSSSSR